VAGELRLVVLIGLPGAGKSTLAAGLACARGWPVVDRDRIRAAMFVEARFSDEEKVAAGEAVWLAVETLLAAGQCCIVDGMTFASARTRERAREIAELNGARCVELWLDLAAAVAANRVVAQAAHVAGDRDAALVHAVAARFESPGAEAVRLDAAEPLGQVLAAALARL
jgi:predicted kinase